MLPARIDTEKLDQAFVRASRAAIRARLGATGQDLLIVRVARCASVYVRSIALGIALTERLRQHGTPATFLHAGFAEDPRAAAAVRRLVDDANRRAGCTIARSETGDVNEACRYLAAADVCLASGRTAIEAIALERPTLAVWGNHYLGLVGSSNIAALADTNFQAWRHRVSAHEEGAAAEAMYADVRAHLRDPAAGALDRRACRAFADRHYSLGHAVDGYEALYDDNAVTLDTPLRHYLHPGTLAGELRRLLLRGQRHTRPVRLLRRLLRQGALSR